MATPKSRTDLAADAETLADSFQYVSYLDQLYAPVDYLTGDGDLVPPIERKCWVPLSATDVQRRARLQFDTAFSERAQLRNFVFMVEQASIVIKTVQPWLLIKTSQGLRVLHEDGTFHEPDGTFVPNMLESELNEDPDDKADLMKIITDWLGGEEEEALSLLRHLATTLAPHWSAGKYVLLVGDGSNGKSVLLSMLKELFGTHNCSGLERQTINSGSTAAFDLNGKLLNLVFDGPAEFIKDSGKEKTLTMGEQISLRKLYVDTQSPVQTNALFVEGLNQEPRSQDKSSALQRRLVRFLFPNKYETDDGFFEHMTSERMLGALLSLLVDNYVHRQDKAIMLSPTARSRQLQRDYMVANSLPLQFILHLEETDPLGAEAALVDEDWEKVFQLYTAWRLDSNDIGPWDKEKVLNQFSFIWETDRKNKRIAGVNGPRKVRYIKGLKRDTLELLASVKEEDNVSTPMVED